MKTLDPEYLEKILANLPEGVNSFEEVYEAMSIYTPNAWQSLRDHFGAGPFLSDWDRVSAFYYERDIHGCVMPDVPYKQLMWIWLVVYRTQDEPQPPPKYDVTDWQTLDSIVHFNKGQFSDRNQAICRTFGAMLCIHEASIQAGMMEEEGATG